MAHWDCRTDDMNDAAIDAWLADSHARRQDEQKARVEGREPPAAPRLTYSACPNCGTALRCVPGAVACPNCEVTPCPTLP